MGAAQSNGVDRVARDLRASENSDQCAEGYFMPGRACGNNTIVIIIGSNSSITQSKLTTFTAGTVAIIIPVFIG
jgi:hypothetical protein